MIGYEAPHPIEHPATCSSLLPTVRQIPDDEYLMVYLLLFAGSMWPISAHCNALHSAALAHALPPLDWMTQQFFTGMHDGTFCGGMLY
jgi:hypothetical protein